LLFWGALAKMNRDCFNPKPLAHNRNKKRQLIKSISPTLSPFHKVHKGFVHYAVTTYGWIVTSEIPIANMIRASFV
jgi:hypothetical protein